MKVTRVASRALLVGTIVWQLAAGEALAVPPPAVNWNAPPAAPVRPPGQPNGQPLVSPVRPPLPGGFPAGVEFGVLTMCVGSTWTWTDIFSEVEARSGVHIDRIEPAGKPLVSVVEWGETAGGAIRVQSGGGGVPGAAGDEIVTFTVFEIDHPAEQRTVVLKIHLVPCS
jgi:hypothetical protein